MALRRLGTASTAIRRVSWGMLFHSLANDAFRDSILLWDLERAFVSNMDQTQKSKGLASGLWLLFLRYEVQNFIL